MPNLHIKTDLASKVRDAVRIWTEHSCEIDTTLGGACAIASYTLWQAFDASEIDARFVLYNGTLGSHCWVESDGKIFDITATQFGGPEVAVFDTSEHPDWFAEAISFDSVKDVFLYDEVACKDLRGWPREQDPITYETEIYRFLNALVITS